MKLYENTLECNIDDCHVAIPVIRQNILDMPTVNPYEWISVEDRLPSWQDGKVLIYTLYGISIAQRTTSNRWKGDCAIPKLITHWMPLLAPPTEKEN
jgi:hypothetical protein